MGLINYKDIDFNKSINKENIVINFNGSEIQIVPYLSIQDKYNLIEATLMKSYEEEGYNPTKLEMYFELHIVFMYTNIVFNTEDKTDLNELYDILKSSGLIKIILEKIPSNELNDLKNKYFNTLDLYNRYHSSIFGFLSGVLGDVVNKIQDSLEVLKTANPELIEVFLEKNPKLAEMIAGFKKEIK